MSDIELLVPDLGDDGEAEVIEVHFSEGDTLNVDDIVVVLESDKATMEIPSEHEGVLKTLKVAVGDQVETGSLLALLTSESTANSGSAKEQEQESEKNDDAELEEENQEQSETEANTNDGGEQKLVLEKVPDTGSDEASELIEIQFSVGDKIEKEQILFVLESDKATMEIPASVSGVVKKCMVEIGDQLKTDDSLCEIETGDQSAGGTDKKDNAPKPKSEKSHAESHKVSDSKQKSTQASSGKPTPAGYKQQAQSSVQDASYRNPNVHAGPAARRLSRELGVDLSLVKPSGPKDRILKDDIKAFVKANLNSKGGSSANPMFDFELPEVDFAKFGEVETQKLSRIKKVSAKNLSRSWLTIPHVTHCDEADISELEKFRKDQSNQLKAENIKLTPLAFLVKACVKTLQAFPRVNASLDKSLESLILKKYFHIGVAVDTEEGLVVPVIRDADQKSVKEIAVELAEISEKARNKKLMPKDMQGACFSISSLGGIGGTSFTPIVNWPELAILGVSRSQMKPVYDGKDFQARLMLPLSLSYDHRVIDGAEAARFCRFLSDTLEDETFLSID